jgi:hypothetical protein
VGEKYERFELQSNQALAADLQAGQWGKLSAHTIWSVCWLPSGLVISGSDEGALVTWKAFRAVAKVHGHDKGGMSRRPDGIPSHNGIRVIKLLKSKRC